MNFGQHRWLDVLRNGRRKANGWMTGNNTKNESLCRCMALVVKKNI